MDEKSRWKVHEINEEKVDERSGWKSGWNSG